jgi:acyl-CoA thioester hydrolase
MLQTRVQIQVRYAETDMMGIVYHGNYLPWFEVSRTTLLKEHGVSYRQLEADGYRLPVLEVGVKYFRPALYDDTVTVVATLKERPTLRIRIDYEVFRGEELLVTGFTQHAFINRDGQPVRPPASFTQRMKDLFAS